MMATDAPRSRHPAAAQAILQHNWMGTVAAHVSHIAHPPLLAQPVKGISSSKGSTHKRACSWLKGAAGQARLRVARATPDSPAQVSLHLHDRLLLQAPLCSGGVALTLLPCHQLPSSRRPPAALSGPAAGSSSSSSSSSVLVLRPAAAPQQDARTVVSYCFAFFDQQDCCSFLASLEALNQQQAARGSGAAAGVCHDAAAAAASDDAKAAIQRFLADPDFQRYVEHVEALWNQVEQELEQQGDDEQRATCASPAVVAADGGGPIEGGRCRLL